jgi:hypothetical protein
VGVQLTAAGTVYLPLKKISLLVLYHKNPDYQGVISKRNELGPNHNRNTSSLRRLLGFNPARSRSLARSPLPPEAFRVDSRIPKPSAPPINLVTLDLLSPRDFRLRIFGAPFDSTGGFESRFSVRWDLGAVALWLGLYFSSDSRRRGLPPHRRRQEISFPLDLRLHLFCGYRTRCF